MKIKLPNVTLVAVSSIKIPQTIKAMEFSCKGIDFGEVKLITDKDFFHYKIKKDLCRPINGIDDYNKFMLLELGNHINTEFCLVIQYDSGVIRPEVWDNNWLSFSYIGAPWPIVENTYIANNGEVARVGNGGFSLRDRIVLDTPRKYGWGLRQEQGYFSEDGNICCYWRKEFLELGIRYAPVEVAAYFSFENEVPENQNVKTFGFHKNIRKEWLKELS
jgi:hypothetical protein